VKRLVALSLALLGCNNTAATEPTKGESPQASAQPAPLTGATAPASASPVALLEGGPPPAPLRGDEALPAEGPSKEGVGYTLAAVFRQADLIGPPRANEVNQAGLEAARKATELKLAIDLSATHMRLTFVGRGFVVPPDTELRAKADRYGHVLVWPGGATYRPLAPGALRALLGERRLDVAPITNADVLQRDETGRRIGIRTHIVDVTTRAAQGSFEVGKLEGAAEGGVLLCRVLLDLMNAPPSTPLCALDELPVRAELKWTNRGSLVFELTGTLKKADMPLTPMLVPPPNASFASAPLPVAGVSPMLTASELGALRTQDVEVPPPPNGVPMTGDTLLVSNSTPELRVLYLDGVPAAWAAPSSRGELHGLKRGKYVAQWRTFLGDAIEQPITQTVPGAAQVGAVPDAGK
jgi:hypothetical protein